MSDDNVISVDMDGTTVNCSLYSLTQGSLSYHDSESGRVSGNVSVETFPSYYMTNCSQEVIRRYWDQAQMIHGSMGPYPEAGNFVDNGDAFVALIFSIGGACIACWMLCVFLVLSPGHKRKPILTQVSIVFNTVVLTILLTKVTDAARSNYYLDEIKVMEIHNVFYASLTFRVTNVFSEALISVAFLQIISKIIQRRFKLGVLAFSVVLAAAYIGSGIICEVSYRSTIEELIYSMSDNNYTRWHQAKNSLKLVYVFWVALLMVNYTLAIKSPRKYSHSKKLLPLAIFIWTLFGIHFGVCVLIVGVFQRNWQNRSWLSIFPNIIEIGILSLVWEWFYDIRSLERRSELMGVLGRRISLEDVTIFQSDQYDKKEGGSRGALNWLKDRVFGYPTVNVYVESENNSKLQSSTNNSSEDPTLNVNMSAREEGDDTHAGHGPHHNESNENNPNQNPNQNQNSNNRDVESGSGNSDYEVEYIDDYELYDRPPSGPSTQENPPPFEPAPGFSRGDYWPEKR